MLGSILMVHLIIAQTAPRQLVYTLVVMRGRKIISKPIVKAWDGGPEEIRVGGQKMSIRLNPQVGTDGLVRDHIETQVGDQTEKATILEPAATPVIYRLRAKFVEKLDNN